MNAVLAALVNGGIASALTAAMIWLILRLVPRHALNAATRYAVWWAAMAIAIALPAFFLPAPVNRPATPLPRAVFTLQPAPGLVEPAPVAPVSRPKALAPEPGFRMPAFPLEFNAGRWPLWLFAAWSLISLALLFRLAASLVMLHRLCARAVEAPARLRESVQHWLLRSGAPRRHVRLIASQDVATPVAIGPWRPSILIPAALLDELESTDLNQIGLHEAAHLARRDDYALILQRVVEALFALHPVVRWIARRIDLEREIACDDLVIAATGNPVSYATCLLRVVELTGGVRSSLAAAGAAEDSSHLARRVDVLLDRTRHTGTLLLKTRLAAMIAILAVLAIAAGRVSGLVAFAKPFAPSIARFPSPRQPAKVTLLPLQAATQPGQTQDLAGRVLEDSSSNPLPSAELRFHKAGMHELAADLDTDRQGRFTASGLPPGDYSVDVLKPNYVTTTFMLHVPSGSPLIRLVRYGVIDGQATDAQGKPLPGRILAPGGRTSGSARVTVLVKPPGAQEFQTFRETALEDAGRYRVYDLPPGEYAVGFWYNSLNDGSGMQLYPDSAHPRIFTVAGGEEYTNINFVVIPRPTWYVSGKVALPPGSKGQFQLALGLPDQPTLPISQTLTEDDGSFRFEKVPAGTYDLFAAGPTGGYTAFQSILSRGGEPLFGRTRVQVSGQNLEDLSLPVNAGRSLKVVLKGPVPEKIPEGCPQSATVAIAPLEPWGIMFMGNAQAGFGKEQAIPNLAPGKFRLDAADLGAGCFQVNHPVVNLGADVPDPVAIELASAGSIKGVLRGGGAFAVVLLDAAATDGAQAHLAFPEADGRFAFESLRPGRYRIAARPSSEATRTRWVSTGKGGMEVDVAGGAPTIVEIPAPVPEGGRQ